MKRKVIYGSLGAFLLIVAGGLIYFNSLLPIITGYAAKNLASGVFVAGREKEEMEGSDLNFSFIKYTRNFVDYQGKKVESRFLWRKSTAIYRDGFGVTLVEEVPADKLYSEVFPGTILPGYNRDTISWPMGEILPDTVPREIDIPKLTDIAVRLVDSSSYGGNAYAFMVLYKGVPVAERYDPQFNKDSRFLSWSMAKSFTNALVALLVKDGSMDLTDRAGINSWQGDEREKITVNDLLQMQSGLKWNEDYGSRSDVNVMLHCKGDMSMFSYEKPLEHDPGSFWYYSSGTSNIVSSLIRKEFSSDAEYYDFAYSKLLYKIGITDAVFEVDAAGNFVGSSYLWATARDSARFGLLFLNDGIFCGERILPEGWVDYTRTPAENSDGEYGAFFWLNKCKKLPLAPEDMYSAEGHDGQYICILPSDDLVVVILGYSPSSAGGIDRNRLISDLLETI